MLTIIMYCFITHELAWNHTILGDYDFGFVIGHAQYININSNMAPIKALEIMLIFGVP